MVRSLSYLKNKWVAGYVPSEQDFDDLFDTIFSRNSNSGNGLPGDWNGLIENWLNLPTDPSAIATKGYLKNELVSSFNPAYQPGVVAAWLCGRGYETATATDLRVVRWKDASANALHLSNPTASPSLIQQDGRLFLAGNGNGGDYFDSVSINLNAVRRLNIFMDFQPFYTDYNTTLLEFPQGAAQRSLIVKIGEAAGSLCLYSEGANGSAYNAAPAGTLPPQSRHILHLQLDRAAPNWQAKAWLDGEPLPGFDTGIANTEGLGDGKFRLGSNDGLYSYQGHVGSIIVVAGEITDAQAALNIEFLKQQAGISF